MALRLIQDYKAMAITQQRSERENLKFQERQKQEQARQLVQKLKKERREVQDRSRRKLQESLERNI